MNSKRKKGTRRNGQMVQRAQGKWLLRVATGVDGSGKRLYKNETYLGTTSQAQKRLTELLRARDTQTLVPTSKLTLSDYVERWADGKIDVAARTREDYRYQLKYITKHLGGLKLTDVSTLRIQECVGIMTTDGLSPRTIEYTVRVLHGALEDAVKESLLVRNVAKNVKTPKKVKRPATVLNMEQVALLLKATANDRLGPLWHLLLTSGMRPQEAFALKWSDFDFEGTWVSINRTLVSDGQGKRMLQDSTKADSKRRLSLPVSTLDALKAHRKVQAAETLKAGAAHARLDLVFCSPKGLPLNIDQVRRQWKAALKATKTTDGKSLPEIRLYDTRHTHLTALLGDGADIAWVSERAGHKDISMTVKHYAHVRSESQRAMGDMTERMLAKAQGTQTASR